MTSPHQLNYPANSLRRLQSWIGKAAAIGCAAIGIFATGLSAKSFEDEYAYIAQSYFADIFFAGRFQDPAWLGLPAYDLPPLPKYFIGLTLRLADLPTARPSDAWNWYDHFGHFGTPLTLRVARLPMIVVGAIGCVAIFGCGVLLKDDRLGIIAAALLILNPLYRLHAHRAMSDVPSEAFTLVALAFFLWWWRRIWSGRYGLGMFLLPGLAGVAAGFALLSKFSGLMSLIIIPIWTGLALVAPALKLDRKLTIATGSIATAVIAIAVFVSLNPFMTAHPHGPLSGESRFLAGQSIWQRFDYQVKHRFMLSAHQKRSYPNDALYTLADKASVFAVQGFGRFGPLGPGDSDSTIRFDLRQDWGAIPWALLVLPGLVMSIRLGAREFRNGRPPTALAVSLWAVAAWAVVTAYLPMAWNRYLLPIQSGNALMAALAVTELWDRLRRRRALLETRS